MKKAFWHPPYLSYPFINHLKFYNISLEPLNS